MHNKPVQLPTFSTRPDSCVECNTQLLANLVDSTPDFVTVRSMDDQLVYMNPAGRVTQGIPLDAEIGGYSTMQLNPEWVCERTQKEWLPRVLAEGSVSGEAAILSRDGTEIPVSFIMVLQKDGDGNPAFISTLARDISAQTKAERDLSRRAREQAALYEFTDLLQRSETLEQVYESALASILSALQCDRASILMFDPLGVMKFVGDKGLSEVYKRAVEGHSPWTRDTPEPTPICIEDVETAELGEDLKTVVRMEGIRALAFVPLVEDSKLIGKFMIYYDRIHSFSGEEMQLATAIARQLSFAVERRRLDQERLKAEEQLRRLAADLEEQVRVRTADLEGFAYSIAHDMRQHIRGVSVNAEMIARDAEEVLNEQARQDLARLVKAAHRMGRLTDDILTHARIGVRDLSRVPIDVTDLAERIAQGLVQRCSCRENTKFDIQPGVTAEGDPAMIELVLENLFDNACKFSANVAQPHIEMGRDERSFYVRDNGIGFEPKYAEKIFEAFERLELGYEGTGVGLANVKRIIERHGGRVWAESAPQKGATIRFTLGQANKPVEPRSLAAAL